MIDIDTLNRRFSDAKGRRVNWDTLFQEIAERVHPSVADFTALRSPGEKRTEKMFDPTAALAARKALAAISAFIWPSNQRYQKLTTSDPVLNKSQAVREYLDDVTDTLFRVRYSPRAAFEAQISEAALQYFVFGTGLMLVEDNPKIGSIAYRAAHLAQCYLSEGADGRVDTVYRCWNWTIRQVAQRWPDKLPQSLQNKLIQAPDTPVEVVHVVMPRTDYDPERIGPRGMPWASLYWLPAEKVMLEDSGYSAWPYAVFRDFTSPGEVYGRSAAWLVLSSIKVLNAQKSTILKAGQKIVDPPLLAADLDVPVSQVPGALNGGTLDSQGNQLVKPLIMGARVDIGLDMMDKEREIIASGFLMDVFRVLVENPNMTATQTLELLNERAIHMAPIGGRIESEALGPMTERELAILADADQLPEMPPELVEAMGEYKIEYTSPMRRAQRSSEAIAISRTMEQVIPMSQVDPSVLDVFDMHLAAREMAEINGVPAKILRDDKAIKAAKDQRASEAQATQLLQAAPVVAKTAADLAKAQAAGGLVPGL